MKKVAIFLSLIFVAILLQACGEVQPQDIKKAVFTNSKYVVKITVDVYHSNDPIIYIYAQEVVYNKEVKTLLIKKGYLGSYSGIPSESAIYIEEATFQFKFTTSVTIKNLYTN